MNLIFDTVDAVADLANRYCNNKQKNGIKKFKKNTYQKPFSFYLETKFQL